MKHGPHVPIRMRGVRVVTNVGCGMRWIPRHNRLYPLVLRSGVFASRRMRPRRGIWASRAMLRIAKGSRRRARARLLTMRVWSCNAVGLNGSSRLNKGRHGVAYSTHEFGTIRRQHLGELGYFFAGSLSQLMVR